jgi:hypothetical protein
MVIDRFQAHIIRYAKYAYVHSDDPIVDLNTIICRVAGMTPWPNTIDPWTMLEHTVRALVAGFVDGRVVPSSLSGYLLRVLHHAVTTDAACLKVDKDACNRAILGCVGLIGTTVADERYHEMMKEHPAESWILPLQPEDKARGNKD